MHAIVLDGGVKSALASVRSLGKAGARVVCGAERATALALHSRFASKRFIYRSPVHTPLLFLEDVEAMVKKASEPPVIYAFSDATAFLLSENRSRFSGIAHMALPSHESIVCAADKGKTLSLASSLGVPVPSYLEATRIEDVETACKQFSFPLVIKPRKSVSFVGGKGTLGRVSFAFTKKEARERVEQEHEASGTYPLLMQYVRGGEYGFEAIAKNGVVLRYVVHKRIRSLSPTGGAAVVKETIEADGVMKKHAEALIRALSWTGVLMLEFKLDDAGVYRLLEINGRFWGSLPLAIFSGCDFPLLYAKLSLGVPFKEEAPDAYKRGVRSRHFFGEIKHLLSAWFSNDPMRPIAYPSRLGALGAFVGGFFFTRYDVFAFSDPLPFFAEALDKAWPL